MPRLRYKLTGSVVRVDDATADRLSPTEWEPVNDSPVPTQDPNRAPRKRRTKNS